MIFTEGGLGAAVICILIEGGWRSFGPVVESIRKGIPIVVCEGTGRAADLLAMVFRQYNSIK